MKTFFIASLLGMSAIAGTADARVHIGIDLFGLFFPPPPPIIEEVVIVEQAPCYFEEYECYPCRRPVRLIEGHVVVPQRERGVIVEECRPYRVHNHYPVRVRRAPARCQR